MVILSTMRLVRPEFAKFETFATFAVLSTIHRIVVKNPLFAGVLRLISIIRLIFAGVKLTHYPPTAMVTYNHVFDLGRFQWTSLLPWQP
jgi:hypothetical protein